MRTLFRILKRLFGISEEKYSDWSSLPVNEAKEPVSDWSQMELSPEELAMVYAAKGWVFDSGVTDASPPTAENIRDIIQYLIVVLESSEFAGAWSNFGRIMVTQDPEYPSYYSVALELGLVPKKGE